MVELFKDRFTEDQLKKADLNKRQIKAVQYVKENGKIMNSEYQELFDVSRATVTRDLTALVEKGFFADSGIKGAGSNYQLAIASIASIY